jgi:hypothetical protein
VQGLEPALLAVRSGQCVRGAQAMAWWPTMWWCSVEVLGGWTLVFPLKWQLASDCADCVVCADCATSTSVPPPPLAPPCAERLRRRLRMFTLEPPPVCAQVPTEMREKRRSPHTPPPFLLTLPIMTSNFEPCLHRRYKWSGTQRFKLTQTFADGLVSFPNFKLQTKDFEDRQHIGYLIRKICWSPLPCAQVPTETREKRRDELTSLQQRIGEGFAERESAQGGGGGWRGVWRGGRRPWPAHRRGLCRA